MAPVVVHEDSCCRKDKAAVHVAVSHEEVAELVSRRQQFVKES